MSLVDSQEITQNFRNARESIASHLKALLMIQLNHLCSLSFYSIMYKYEASPPPINLFYHSIVLKPHSLISTTSLSICVLKVLTHFTLSRAPIIPAKTIRSLRNFIFSRIHRVTICSLNYFYYTSRH